MQDPSHMQTEEWDNNVQYKNVQEIWTRNKPYAKKNQQKFRSWKSTHLLNTKNFLPPEKGHQNIFYQHDQPNDLLVQCLL